MCVCVSVICYYVNSYKASNHLMTAAWCCACVRFRRHDCKHIRLILQQLGVEQHPDGWEQVGVKGGCMF